MAKETRDISLDGVVEHLPCHLLRRPNGIKSVTEDPATCDLCIAKASVLNRIKVLGGDIVEAVAKAKEHVKTKPAGIMREANFKGIKAKGGYVVKTETKENGEGKPVLVATMRMADACTEGYLAIRPRTPLLPLTEDDFSDDDEHLRESTRAGAAFILASIERQENNLAQIAEKGHVTLDLEVQGDFDIGGNNL